MYCSSLQLISWNSNEIKIIFSSFCSKRTVSNRDFIETICDVLRHSNVLSSKCAIDLIRLIEELARYSISPIELKSLFCLLREKENFDYRKHLLQVRIETIFLFPFLAELFSQSISFFRLWQPYHCIIFQAIKISAANFSIYRHATKELPCQRFTNGQHREHSDSYFMHGFVWMKF